MELAPVTSQERISVIDSLRGFALLGILMMNIPYFSGPHQAAFDLTIRQEFSGPNYWAWWGVYGLFEGTMRGMFSMLFGAGSLLLLERLQAKEPGLYPADIYFRRLLILIAFGLINAFVFNWAGDILFSYGVCGLFLFPFRKLRPASLAMIGVGCLLVVTLFMTVESRKRLEKRDEAVNAMALEKQGHTLDEKQAETKKEWLEYLKRHTPEAKREAAAKTTEGLRGGYLQVMGKIAPVNIKFESIKLYKEMFWDAMGFFLIGMALFKWGVLTGRRSTRFYASMAILGLGLGLSLNFFMLNTVLEAGFNWINVSEKVPVPPYQLRRLLMTLGYIGLLMTLYRMGWFGAVFGWLSKVGQMAFTNYLSQTIICTLIFYGYGLGYFGKLERYQTYLVVAAIWVFQIAFSNIWLRYFRFGPFEWVWRSLTYGKRQPMAKARAGQEAFVG